MFVDEKAIEYFTSDAILVKINAEEDSLVAQEYHIMGYPTTVLVDKDGNEVDRLVGYAPTEDFIGILDDYTRGIGTLAHYLDSAKSVEDRSLYFQIADKYKYRGESESAEEWYMKVVAASETPDSLAGQSRIALADMFRRSEEYDKALEAFASIEEDFDGTPFAADAAIYQGIVYRAMADTAMALTAFEEVAKNYPDSDYSEYALRQIGLLTGEGESAE
ncbi:tetratricopeptide repeat protein [candidate division GN15 bacterium]|nr:tetratricopeptide repeat protein [candidate division GN15 bacterium]